MDSMAVANMASTVEIRADLATLLGGNQDTFACAAAIQGEVFRDVKGRRTLRFSHNNHSYFIKIHQGVGWAEIFKNLLTLRLPVIGASNEYFAIKALDRLQVPTLTIAAFARRGANPARQESFLVTDELPPSVNLEEYCGNWPVKPPSLRHKRALIRQVAQTSRALHDNGINHRDYYLCHFHLDLETVNADSPVLYLIDLHRAQLRAKTPRRWRLKDIAGLYFSALDIGLTRGDILTFIRAYTGMPLARALVDKAAFWRAAERKAHRLYAREHRR